MIFSHIKKSPYALVLQFWIHWIPVLDDSWNKVFTKNKLKVSRKCLLAEKYDFLVLVGSIEWGYSDFLSLLSWWTLPCQQQWSRFCCQCVGCQGGISYKEILQWVACIQIIFYKNFRSLIISKAECQAIVIFLQNGQG